MEEESQSSNSYAKRPLWHWLLIYAIVAVVLYGLLYYFVLAKNNGYNNNQAGSYQQSPSPMIQKSSPTPNTASQKITIKASEFAFMPSEVVLKKGQPVEITFINNGKYPHNLTIVGLNVKSNTIQSGQQDIVSFTPDKTGSFAFVCTVPGHADKGMKGTLTVE